MLDRQTEIFIDKMLAEGKGTNDIAGMLEMRGWKDEDIQVLIDEYNAKSTGAPAPNTPPQQTVASTPPTTSTAPVSISQQTLPPPSPPLPPQPPNPVSNVLTAIPPKPKPGGRIPVAPLKPINTMPTSAPKPNPELTPSPTPTPMNKRSNFSASDSSQVVRPKSSLGLTLLLIVLFLLLIGGSVYAYVVLGINPFR